LISYLLNHHKGKQIHFRCWYIPNIRDHFLSISKNKNFHWTFFIRCVCCIINKKYRI
jgi:hypothetical protein